MGPDVPARLGFSYPTLRKINPGLIYCSIKGAVSKSRYNDRPAFDAVAQALSGMMSLMGEEDRDPVRIANPAVDLGAAAYGAVGILGAILERQKTRKGKFIEISLLDMSVYWNGYWLTYYGMTQRIPKRMGPRHPGYSPHAVFKTKDGKQFLIATLSDAQWKKLSELLALNMPGDYDRMEVRIDHRGVVEERIQQVVGELSSTELSRLLGSSVPYAEVRTIDQIYDDPELQNLDVLENTVDFFDKDRMVRVARTPNHVRSKKKNGISLAPKLGQDTDSILKSIGYSAKEIQSFKQSRYL
jgi:crotonobetainyl-CoA:carnitine CoA-transferase CaiB-like acyl-CoA transferase